jgi:hypothetical protein
MPDDTPAVPPTSAQAIVAALSPLPINIEEAQKQAGQYKSDLEKTRGALSQVQGQRQDVTTRNLTAIDEAIKGLKESRTGTYGLDPAVTAAMAAGFLRTTPGVAGNFMSELGNAMGNAAPVISSLQTKDRDSWQILADLQRKRGEFEAEPLKERQTELSAREKLEFANLREAEKALARAPTGATAEQKINIDKEKIAADFMKSLEAEMKSYTEDKMDDQGQPFTPDHKDAIRRYVRYNRINENNYGKKEGDPGWIDPGRAGLRPGDEDIARHLMRTGTALLKGNDKVYDDYRKGERAQGRDPKPREIWEADNKGNAAFVQQRAKDDAEKLDKSPVAIAVAQQTSDTVDRLLNHPGLDKVVGISPLTQILPNMSAEARNFAEQMKLFKSELFLQGVAQMKGMGQLSDAEGRRLETAIAAVGTAQTPADFRAELQRVKESVARMKAAVEQDIKTIKARRGIDQQKPPDVGEVRDGHRFKGGNPGDPKNWEPI